MYVRTCQRPSCTIKGTTSPWTNIDLQGSCCEGDLCNRGALTQSFTSASDTAAPRVPPVTVLLLTISLLGGALGGTLGLSS